MATRDVFSAEELAQLRGFPKINRADLIRYFMLTGPDEVFLRKYRRARNVLGVVIWSPAAPVHDVHDEG